jgi:hypothetical protein
LQWSCIRVLQRKKKPIRDVAIEGEIYYENGLMLITDSEKTLNLICLGAR